jgi:uncharacterized DUF497 family protein
MITWDDAKRLATLAQRGLDFADAGGLFAGLTATLPDGRQDYGEPRFITGGWLDGRFVVVVWTPRDGGKRIISMRYGHADEESWFREQLD